MAEFDLAIRNGMVIDGAGNPRQRTDVAINDGRIAKVGRVGASDAKRVIDADGLVVAPGFIDLHTHYDAQLFWDPYLTNSGWHGVTSVVTGNCGFGFAPVRPDERERSMLSMTSVEAIPTATLREGLPWDWVTYPEYLDSIDRAALALNVLPYVPLNPLLIWVLGLEAAKAGEKPTDDQHCELVRLLGEALEAGGCGWSAQCLGQPNQPDARLPQGDFDGSPMPTDVMWPETRLAMAEVLGQRGEGFMQASGVPFDEVEALVEASGRPYIWQAVVANTKTMHYKSALEWIGRCRARGLPVYGQAMTTDAHVAFALSNPDVMPTGPLGRVHAADTTEQQKQILAEPGFRTELAEFESMAFNTFDEMKLLRTESPQHKRFEGRTLGDIAAELGVTAVDVACDASIADDFQTVLDSQQFSATLDGLKELVDDPYLIPGLSDGGAHVSFLTAGFYGTEYIARYVRDHEFTTLEAAHQRLSALPAHCAGFRDRGTLSEGSAADIIVYDYETVDYLPPEFVHDLPAGQMRSISRATGYHYTLVNGGVIIDDDKETGATPGRLLRHGNA